MRMHSFSRWLFEQMLLRKWTHSEIAKRTGLSREIISSYVRGGALPSTENLQKIDAAFAMPVDPAPQAPRPDRKGPPNLRVVE